MVKAKLLYILSLRVVINFSGKNGIYCYKFFEKLVIDNSFKDKNIITELIEIYKKKKVIILAYHLKTHDIIKK